MLAFAELLFECHRSQGVGLVDVPAAFIFHNDLIVDPVAEGYLGSAVELLMGIFCFQLVDNGVGTVLLVKIAPGAGVTTTCVVLDGILQQVVFEEVIHSLELKVADACFAPVGLLVFIGSIDGACFAALGKKKSRKKKHGNGKGYFHKRSIIDIKRLGAVLRLLSGHFNFGYGCRRRYKLSYKASPLLYACAP